MTEARALDPVGPVELSGNPVVGQARPTAGVSHGERHSYVHPERVPHTWSGIPRTLAVLLIRTYQAARAGHPSPCRFTPTCSQYAAEAIYCHGMWRGLGLAAKRLARCRPGGPFGADPVPD